MTWQPIETAPRDGTRVLAWANGAVRIAFWDEDRPPPGNICRPRPYWQWSWPTRSETDRANPPTHWQPLPEPPTGESR